MSHCHLVLILYLKCGVTVVWGGGGGVLCFLTFYAIYDISRKKNLYAGNIEKCPFSYWLNGRWFLQIVDIHVGNFNMKLTGRWMVSPDGR